MSVYTYVGNRNPGDGTIVVYIDNLTIPLGESADLSLDQFATVSERYVFVPGSFPTVTSPTVKHYVEQEELAESVELGKFYSIITSTAQGSKNLDLEHKSRRLFKVTLTGISEFTFLNVDAGANWVVELIQDGTGGRTASFLGTTWVYGTPTLNTASNAVEVINFYAVSSSVFLAVKGSGGGSSDDTTAIINEAISNLPKDAATTTPSMRTLGIGAQQAAAGNDSRLSDQRTPANSSVTDAKVSSSAAIGESKLNLASDAADATASRRTLGTTGQKAAKGSDFLAHTNDNTVHAPGKELGYSEISASEGSIGTTEINMTDLSVTFTALTTKAIVLFNAKQARSNTSSDSIVFSITDNANVHVVEAVAQCNSVAATDGFFYSGSISSRARLSGLTVGNSYTFKIRGVATLGIGLLSAFPTFPSSIQAISL